MTFTTVFIVHGKTRFSHFMVVSEECGDELMSIEVLTLAYIETCLNRTSLVLNRQVVC